MFRSQAQPCYPETSTPDGCFPDNSASPSPFKCWLDGMPSRTSPEDRDAVPAKRPSRPAPATLLRLFRPND
jgi:hypothetical protein